MNNTNTSNAKKIDQHTNSIARVCKVEKLGGEGWTTCQCCGKEIRNVHIMSNGLRLGSECATWIEMPYVNKYLCQMRLTKKIASMLAASGYEF